MSKTILIVEDDRALARMWTELLASEGFNVVAEKDGDWAVKTATSRKIDLILLDVLIPVRNGFQVAERLRKTAKCADIPIVMVSGIYRSASHRRQAIEKYDLIDYLDKPVRNEDLLDLLQQFFADEYPSSAKARRDRSRLEQRPAEDFAAPQSHAEVKEVEEASSTDFRGPSVGRGKLDSRPFPELLSELFQWKATGALLLKRQRVKKIVYFKNGYPFSVKSNLLEECLGKVMVRERMISSKQCEESLELMKMSGRMQGTVLIEMGLISPHNLVFALELQLLTKLLSVFRWKIGSYQFTSRTDLPAQTVTLDLTPAAIIWEGVQDHWAQRRARDRLGDVGDHYVVPATDPLYRYQEMDLGPDAEEFFRKINGRRTVEDLLALELLEEDKAWPFLYALSAAKMVEIRPERVRRSEHVPSIKPPKLPPRPPPLPGSARPSKTLLPELDALVAAGTTQPKTERQVKTRLLKQLEGMRRQSHFEVLGVARTAPPAEIRKAYFALAREYHPDKLAGSLGDEVRQLAGEIYDAATRAFEILSDEEERRLYEEQLSSGARKKEMSDEVSRILAAEGKFQRGEEFLRSNKWQKANEAFREAVDLYPEEGEFHAYLGWSLFQTAPDDDAVYDECLDHIMRAVQLSPKIDKSYLFLGYMYKARGRKDKAEKQFEKAIQCNPDCTEALRELRLFASRGQ